MTDGKGVIGNRFVVLALFQPFAGLFRENCGFRLLFRASTSEEDIAKNTNHKANKRNCGTMNGLRLGGEEIPLCQITSIVVNRLP